MPEGFEAEVLAALRELTEGQHRVEAALAMVHQDMAAVRSELAGLRDDVLVATSVATGAEERVDDTRAILRTVLKGQQELRHRVARLEERGREDGS